MLSYLVTSRVRRRLIQLLWGEGGRGSATELAGRAEARFAGVYRELKAMRQYHMVEVTIEGGKEIYSANPDLDSEDVEVLKRLASSRPQWRPPRDARSERARRGLRALGAPLPVEPASSVPDIEGALVEGVRLARRDATVARVMPMCFAEAKPRLDRQRLLAAAKRLRERQAVGFFLALTGELTGDPTLVKWASAFRDRRIRHVQDFFESPPTSGSREFADRRTPGVARRWRYRMNMGLDSFTGSMEKRSHVR